MDVFNHAYPYVVLMVGSIAAAGGMFAGIICAWVFITHSSNEQGDTTERAILGAFALAAGCAVCIICLAFTKWILSI